MSGRSLRKRLARRRGMACILAEAGVALGCATVVAIARWQASLVLASLLQVGVGLLWLSLFEEGGCAVVARSPVPDDGTPWSFLHAGSAGALGCGRCRACAH